MSEDEFNSLQKRIMGWLLIAVLGGNTGVILLNKSSPEMRSDPFTGSQGKELRNQISSIENRMDRVEAEQGKLIYRIDQSEAWQKDCRQLVQEHLRDSAKYYEIIDTHIRRHP